MNRLSGGEIGVTLHPIRIPNDGISDYNYVPKGLAEHAERTIYDYLLSFNDSPYPYNKNVRPFGKIDLNAEDWSNSPNFGSITVNSIGDTITSVVLSDFVPNSV